MKKKYWQDFDERVDRKLNRKRLIKSLKLEFQNKPIYQTKQELITDILEQAGLLEQQNSSNKIEPRKRKNQQKKT